MQKPGTLCFLEEGDFQDVFVKNHWSHGRKSYGMSHLVRKLMPHEEYLMKALSRYEKAKDKTRPLAALKAPACIGTGWTICRVTLMPHFKADISELSKLSRALRLTDNSRTSFYTRTPLIQSLWQEEKKSALTLTWPPWWGSLLW